MSDQKKVRYWVTNWQEYNQALKNRGSLTFLFEEGFEQHWLPVMRGQVKRGRPLQYSEYAINLILSFRHLFKLPLRQTTGFVESILLLMDKDLPVPEFSRLSRRTCEVLSRVKLPPLEKDSYIIVDSTGLKVFGEKEWLETKHGKQYQRKVWRKFHIGIDQEGKVIARVLSDHKTDDRAAIPDILHQINIDCVTDFLGDTGYDSHHLYEALEKQNITPIIPLPHNAVIRSQENPTRRDKTVDYIQRKGYWAWHVKNDYGRRNKVENTFYRLKTIFGRKLSSRLMKNQDAETHLMCHLLNKMTDLGMPKTIKIT